MYLKALEIQGFKSFADKTRLTFEKDITAIVGPNGSGKSNISDAILWVMGEQRTKTLRGSKMEDVIFGGTEIRSPMGFAEVSLIIDNSAHIFESDNSEVELTRRYYRSGDSEYYINREQVRLKDINSLLMDTGLGRDGYSIIGQGKIAEIVSTKNSERREVFDEAAGISRFRYRKEEAEHRLEKTDESLLRINDKIEELELQVGPLKKQSETAKKYLVLRDELRQKEISSWMSTLEKLHEKADLLQKEYDEAKLMLEKATSARESLYASTESLTERMHNKDEESEKARDRLSAKESEIASCKAKLAGLGSDVKNSEESLQRMLSDISQQEARSKEIRSGIAENEKRISEIEEERKELQKKIKENNNVIDGVHLKLSGRENSLNAANEKLSRISVDRRSTESRISMLSEMEKSFEGFGNAVKSVMKARERGTLRGIHSPVANLLRADEECALAIETALGAAAQNIVVDTKEDGRLAIEMLKRADAGRATFMPLESITGTVMKDAPVNDFGFVGIAYDLVRFDPKYDKVVANILGRTVIAETLTDAVRISRKYNDKYKIVTLDGQVMNPGGSMTGGSSARNSGVLSRANELEKLRKNLAELSDSEKRCSDDVDRLKKEMSGLRYELEMAQEDRNELSSSDASLSAEASSLKLSVGQLSALLDAISGDSETSRMAIENVRNRISSVKNTITSVENDISTKEKEAEKIRNEIAEISESKLQLEGTRGKAEKEIRERNDEIDSLSTRVSRAEQKIENSEYEEKQILDKLWDNYELSYSSAKAQAQPVENIQKINKEISDLRRSISALGTPNLGAISEYERVSERYGFLTNQRDDIEKAKSELLGIIRDVTKEMKDLFSERFKLIDEAFRQTFTELFGGGKAALILEDENNVLECGIEIKVQPPGKQLSNISLMSGGEMAFVAIALYFAILKVRPTPFCVMDEIEAALDEANVGRYAEYMRRMAVKTQFLVITHRRGTMEEADMLYGVTMQEKGVSSVLELDIEQAKKSAED